MTTPANDPPKSGAKVSIVPLILAALAGGSAVFILLQLQFSAWVEPPASLETAPPIIETNPTALLQTNSPEVPSAVVRPVKNGLRVSNRSAYALRVVLLMRQTSDPAAYAPRPAHWDFAPKEGSQNGLLLSLPGRRLTLASGDVLFAFALDGSRRYWGPYVVGATAIPKQTASSLEWQLVLNP